MGILSLDVRIFENSGPEFTHLLTIVSPLQKDPVTITADVENIATANTKYPCPWSFTMDRTSGDIVITGKVDPIGTDRFGHPCPECEFQVTYKENDGGSDSVKICISDYYVGYNYTVVNPNGTEQEQKDEGICADADDNPDNDVPWEKFCPDSTCEEGEHQGNDGK